MTKLAKSRRPVLLWLLIRTISIPVALLAFHFGSGAGSITSMRSLLAPWYAWDAYYYVAIVKNGYQPNDATSNFHPLYPWTSTLVALVFRDPLLSLLVVASIAGLLLTIMFQRLARLDCSEEQSWQATALMLVWPASVALFVPYTEALFLLLSVCCLLSARTNHFWLAGLAGGLATLTRQQGLFLALPLAWEAWQSSAPGWSNVLKRSLPILMAPAGYAAWILYRAIAINDVSPDFSSVQKFIYSVMISPTTYNILDQQQFLPPWVAIWKAVTVLWRGQVHAGAYVDIALGLVFIGLLVLSWRHLRASYRVYSLVIILVSLSFYTGAINPYISLPRHLVLAFPVFIGLASRYNFRQLPAMLVALTLCQMGLLCSFVWQTWIL